MTENIVKLLQKFEKRHSIKILYAADTGSRSWNCESSYSDFDIKFIYKYKDESIYKENGKIKTELGRKQRTNVRKDTENNVDFHGWDISKALKHTKETNPALIEWLSSSKVYINVNDFQRYMLGQIDRSKVKSSLLRNYSGYSKSKYKKSYSELIFGLIAFIMRFLLLEPLLPSFIETKKFLCVVRSLMMLEWVRIQNPHNFKLKLDLLGVLYDLRQCGILDYRLHQSVLDLINCKKNGKKSCKPKKNLVDWVENKFKVINTKQLTKQQKQEPPIFENPETVRWYEAQMSRFLKKDSHEQPLLAKLKRIISQYLSFIVIFILFYVLF